MGEGKAGDEPRTDVFGTHDRTCRRLENRVRTLHQRRKILKAHELVFRPVPPRRDQYAANRQRGGDEVREIDLFL